MTHDEIINAWNKQADYMNKWDRLGEDEKLEWAIKLEREACAEILDANAMACNSPIMRSLLQSNAQAIRARGQA